MATSKAASTNHRTKECSANIVEYIVRYKSSFVDGAKVKEKYVARLLF